MPQFLMILDGMIGSGKTTLGNDLFKKISRFALVGMDRVKRNVSDYRRGEKDNEIARKIVYAMSEVYLKQNISVCVEQPFESKKEIEEYEKLSKDYSVSLYKIQLIADPKVAFERVKNRQKHNPLAHIPTELIWRFIERTYSRKECGFIVIETTNKKPIVVQNEVFSFLLEKNKK